MADVADAAVAALGSRVRRAVRLGDGRYAFELPLDPAPERLRGATDRRRARLISLNPIRDTLEDFFVRQVSTPEATAPRRGLEAAS